MKRNKILIIGLLFVALGCGKDEIESEEKALPLLNVEYEGVITKEEKTPILLCETGEESFMCYEGKIKRRGGFSIGFPKHSYEIDLDEDISLAGLPEDDDWILNANYIDKTFLRHVISYELFLEMGEKNIASRSEYIEVALNGVYNGLYVLMEKLDKSSLKINDKDPSAVIFKEPHIFRMTYDGVIPQDADNFHQQTFPKIEDEDKTAYIESIREFILSSNDADFELGFSNVFDLENIIDWHLLLLISNNNDGVLKNFYLYKVDSETPARISPWDYDHSFGRDGDNELNLDERPLTIERSILFSRLLTFDWYKQMLKARWEHLNAVNMLSKSGLRQRFITRSEFVKEFANKNFVLWPVSGPWYYDSNDFDQEIDIIMQFIELRHKRLSDYFDAL